MSTQRIAYLGDVVGAPGRRVFEFAARRLRDDKGAALVIVNGENVRHGSGLHPDGYRALRAAGADAITLGDHWYRAGQIFPILDNPGEPICRPANLSASAHGRPSVRVDLPGSEGEPPVPLHVIVVLGRLFMSLPANDPFATVDRLVEQIAEQDERSLVIIEVHAETTSEKIAMTWHCSRKWPGRVVAVLGTHTHVQTADARIVDHSLAAMTDLGMCGGHRGVIGRQIDPVLRFMTDQNPAPFDVAELDLQANGCVITLDTSRRIATGIERVNLRLPD